MLPINAKMANTFDRPKKKLMKVSRTKLVVLATLSLSMVFINCKKDTPKSQNNSEDIATQINSLPNELISNSEEVSLKKMCEEEKLAHDVYVTLYNKWGVNIFNNIAASEQTHANAVLLLLNKYNIVNSFGANGIGVFSDSTLQVLYNQLVSNGNVSILDAYKIGATIEDLDIYDLNNATKIVDNQDIKFVYANLNKGSRNHMRSFYAQITNAGGSYLAQYISQVELDAIINTPRETGSW